MVGFDRRSGFYRCQLARLCAHALNWGQIVQFDPYLIINIAINIVMIIIMIINNHHHHQYHYLCVHILPISGGVSNLITLINSITININMINRTIY